MTRHAFICDAVRTPFGRYGGALSSVRADDRGRVLESDGGDVRNQLTRAGLGRRPLAGSDRLSGQVGRALEAFGSTGGNALIAHEVAVAEGYLLRAFGGPAQVGRQDVHAPLLQFGNARRNP